MERFLKRWGLRASALCLATLGPAVIAHADAIPYPTPGLYNPVTYTFTAMSTGDVNAYIVGGFGAAYENRLGLLVNGVGTGVFGLDNHSSNVGDSLDLGPVNAGDTLTFVLENLSLGKNAYSDPSLNGPYDAAGVTNHNHIYSTIYTTTGPTFAGVPAGTYVAFEDLPFPGADFNYNDESFVFTNVGASPSVATTPLPSTAWAGLGLLGCLGSAQLIRRRKLAAGL